MYGRDIRREEASYASPPSRLGGLNILGVCSFQEYDCKRRPWSEFSILQKKKDLLFNPHGLWKDISMFRWFGFADIYLLIALASVFFCTFAVFDVVFVRIYFGRILVLTCYVVKI
jgi:hypothetical protein